jgi:hypothetical protein
VDRCTRSAVWIAKTSDVEEPVVSCESGIQNGQASLSDLSGSLLTCGNAAIPALLSQG